MLRLWWAFVRFFFRLLYNELAWTYDLVAWAVSLGQWRAWGRTALGHLRGKRVLELAHGPGHLQEAMAEQAMSPVGLDLSPHMGRLAQRRLRKKRLTVPLVRARAQALPFRDECFDSAIASFPTDFILYPATLQEAARVMRTDGRLVVVAWAGLGGRDAISRFIGWLYQVTGQGKPPPDAGKKVAAQAGLTSHVVWEQVGRSKVMLTVAQKQTLKVSRNL
ncbi:MAG: methyltransferase domain-containing protein [Chloroflexota bacterium]|nr:methyltransferase domain-containing protein [Chloroflexota bacterium]